jgi:hypothetical protein
MLAALLKAERFLNEQPKKVADVIAVDMKIAPNVMDALVPTNHYTAVIDQSVIDGIAILQEELLSAKKLKSKADPFSLFDLRLLRELAPDLIKVKVEAR